MAFTVTLVSSLSRWDVEGKWRDKTITMGKEGSVVIAYILQSFQKFSVFLFCSIPLHVRAALSK